MVAAQDYTALLGGHKAVFHDVSQVLCRGKLHDARRPLEGMSRPHQGLETVSVLRIAFQGEQSVVQQRRLRLRLHAEQMQQGHIAVILATTAGHKTSFRRARNKSSSSRYPTPLSCQSMTP